MTDRELLELAAKAARLDVWFAGGEDHSGGYPCGMDSEGGCETWWNPLADDGDALRLAVKLKLTICRSDCQCCVDVYGDMEHPDIEESVRFKEIDGEIGDPYAATRRAIVRAAAEIGRNKL